MARIFSFGLTGGGEAGGNGLVDAALEVKVLQAAPGYDSHSGRAVMFIENCRLVFRRSFPLLHSRWRAAAVPRCSSWVEALIRCVRYAWRLDALAPAWMVVS
ncbi:hypothetical protein CH92_13980 [Stutzerimonas stutzeri]|uniref:Uncharacterized protein n=1 Tax=Stutzerimonas stutzeri TaxID=316 RepID=W8RGL0_STUST|nr:hypothetical protein CH92_13980 [Stutzerimonas stutzeri]